MRPSTRTPNPAAISPAGSCPGPYARGYSSLNAPAVPGFKDFQGVQRVSLYPRNTVLFMQQQEPRGIYLVCEGRLKLSLSSVAGRITNLRLARRGEILGLAAVLLGTGSKVTAETLQTCRVAFVSKEDFLRIVGRSSGVCRNMLWHLALQHEAACEQMRTVGLGLSLRERLSRFLLHWVSEEQPTGNSGAVDLPLNHEEIAACIGATRESVTRAFRELKDLGMVSRNGYGWLISHPGEIRKLAWRHANPRGIAARHR